MAKFPKIKNDEDIVRSIELDPIDWHYATWRDLKPVELPKPRPFDLKTSLEAFYLHKLWNHWSRIDFDLVEIPLRTSVEEAHFWYELFTHMETHGVEQKLVDKLSELDFTGKVPLSRVVEDLKSFPYLHCFKLLKLPLAHLLEPEELVTLFLETRNEREGYENPPCLNSEGFHEYVLPHLDVEGRAVFRKALRPLLDKSLWPWEPWKHPTPFHLAASLGLGDELLALVESWPKDHFYYLDNYYPQYPQRVVLGLNDPKLVVHHMRRLKLSLFDERFARAWLAHTEFSALDDLADAVCAFEERAYANEVMSALALVKAPEAVGPVLRCALESQASMKAQEWLRLNPQYEAIGLVPLAAGKTKLAALAEKRLKVAVGQGRADEVKTAIERFPANIRRIVGNRVLDWPLQRDDCFSDEKPPEWLTEAMEKYRPRELPRWLEWEELPPIMVGEKSLSMNQVTILLLQLVFAESGVLVPMVKALKEHANAGSLTNFGWRLFELWKEAGASLRDVWAFNALGQLGDDTTVLKLAPIVRAWPGKSRHSQAKQGLSVLYAIGSSLALQEIADIAGKVKYKNLKAQAGELMHEIAKDNGLTMEQLEDRVVPDCGLSKDGNHIFDYGKRKFFFAFGQDMKPEVKDEKGKRRANLPKAGKRDDSEKANSAIEAWRLMKKKIRQVGKLQARRLELAMINGRRWSQSEFNEFIVNHPLVTHLAQSLLWGDFAKDGKLKSAFRVTKEREYASIEDDLFELEDSAEVGVVHPLLLKDEALSQWGQIFGDYELMPPFPQLGRSVHHLNVVELKREVVKRFEGKSVSAPRLVFGLEQFGWRRGIFTSSSKFQGHYKVLHSADAIALLNYDGFVYMHNVEDMEPLTIRNLYFITGTDAPGKNRSERKKLKLSSIPPILVSEVIRDIHLLAAKDNE